MKQMLHPKRVRLWLSLVLAFLLTVLTVPFAAFADGEEAGEGAAVPQELLLRLNALDQNSATYNPKDLTLVNSEPQGFNANSFIRGNDVKSNFVSNAVTRTVKKDGKDTEVTEARPWGGIALNTGLDLTADTPYTFEFYVKCTEEVAKGKVQFCIGFLTDGSKGYDTAGGNFIFTDHEGAESTVFILQNDGKYVGHIDGWTRNGNTATQKKWEISDNFWTSGANEDGYTRIVMTYETGKITLYSGNDSLGSYKLGELKVKDIANYKKVNLTAGFYNISVNPKSSTTNPVESGKVFADMKDISIYSGAHTPRDLDILEGRPVEKYVQFEKEDGTLLKSAALVNGSLTVESFPEVTTTKELYWVDKNTGKLVQAPMTFTDEAVIVAKEVGANRTEIFGVQNNTPAGGKVNVRFVGGVYNLTGDCIGFDIVVRNKNANGEPTEQSYRKEGNTVYTSILADGVTLTAADKGVNYFFALELEDLSASGELEFEIKPFKMVRGMRVYGDKVTATMKDGAFVTTPQE